MLSDPAKTPPGRSTRRACANRSSCIRGVCTWCSIVKQTTAVNRPSSNGRSSPLPCTTVTPGYDVESAAASDSSTSSAVSRGTASTSTRVDAP